MRELLSRLDPEAGAKAEAKQKALEASSRLQSIFPNHDRDTLDESAGEDGGFESQNQSRRQQRRRREDLKLNSYEQTIAMEVISPSEIPVTFEDIGGLEDIIEELQESVIYPLTMPHLYASQSSLLTAPSGVLLYGPPGTGKTLLARAVAHHTDCKFIRVSGSELVQKYIGEGSRMVRELFVMAREHAPSIIFMDEIDSIGSSRGDSGSGGGDSEVQRTMLELLNQLDGFEPTKNIKVIMATNRIGKKCTSRLSISETQKSVDILDPAHNHYLKFC